MAPLKWQVMKGLGRSTVTHAIPNTLWAFIFSSLIFLFLGLCEWVCSQTEKGWCVRKGGAQCWSCISFLLHGIYCTSAAQCPEKGNIAKLWLAWLMFGDLDLSIGDAELKGAPFFRRRRKFLEGHVDLCETWGHRTSNLKWKDVLSNQAEKNGLQRGGAACFCLSYCYLWHVTLPPVPLPCLFVGHSTT